VTKWQVICKERYNKQPNMYVYTSIPFYQIEYKLNIQVDCLSYCAIESQHKMLENKSIVSDFTRADSVAIVRLTTDHNSPAVFKFRFPSECLVLTM